MNAPVSAVRTFTPSKRSFLLSTSSFCLHDISVGSTLASMKNPTNTLSLTEQSPGKGYELRALLLLAILLVSIIYFDSPLDSRASSGAVIPTGGGTWATSTITIVIYPQPNALWFKPSYSSDVARAISRWTESIIAYTDAHGSSYLRKLGFLAYISGVNQSIPANPDIQIEFIQTFLGALYPLGLGVTIIPQPVNGIFSGQTTTRLAAYDPTNTTQLTDSDMINIASHEFGHALGLDHATVSATDDGTFELMFMSYGQAVGNSANSLEAPSTLDMFALSYVYDWLANYSMPSGGHPRTLLSLPPGVAYSSVYPYAEQIQMLQNSVSQLRLEILIVAVVAGLLLALVLVFGILLSRRKPAPPVPYSWGPVPTTPTA